MSLNLALSCPSSSISYFRSNPEDQDTPKEDNEQERDGSEQTFPRKRNGSSAQEGDGRHSKRFRIIIEEEEYKWSLPNDNDNSEKYIPEKDVKDEIALSRRPLTLSRKAK